MDMENQGNQEMPDQPHNETEKQAELQQHDEEDDSKKEEEWTGTNSGNASTLADAATPASRNLLAMIHEFLEASGFSASASMLLDEAQLTPKPSIQFKWPSGRTPYGFPTNKLKINARDEEPSMKSEVVSAKKKSLRFSSSFCTTHLRHLLVDSLKSSGRKCFATGKESSKTSIMETPSSLRSQQDRFTAEYVDNNRYSISNPSHMSPFCRVLNDHQVQKPQHVCPEPERNLDAPSNVTARLGTREYKFIYGGVHGSRRDRQFVCSLIRPWRTFKDDAGALFTCITFVGDSSRIAVGSHIGELIFFDYSNNSNVVESFPGHLDPLTFVQSFVSGDNQLLLSSSYREVKLWDATSILSGPTLSFEGCKAARFSNSGNVFAALRYANREILLYDIQTCQLESKLSFLHEASRRRSYILPTIHFNPSDSMLYSNGILWDWRVSVPVHRFEHVTDYWGGGFHPAGNEVIINNDVWDLRNFRLQHTVPSLDKTSITFNARGDLMYAILRKHLTPSSGRKHPLFHALGTLDAINYSDIATIPLGFKVEDFASEPTDSFFGLVAKVDPDETNPSARIYKIGSRRPTDDDSDHDDAGR